MKRLLLYLLLFIGTLAIKSHGQIATNALQESESVSNLVFMIRQPPHSKMQINEEYAARVAAIKKAAEIKNPDPQIIDALLDNILCLSERVPMISLNSPKYAVFPAHDALVTIGEPVIPVLLKKLKSVDDEKLRAQDTFLLQEIAGKTRSSELLKTEISDLSVQKSRLIKSLQLLQ